MSFNQTLKPKFSTRLVGVTIIDVDSTIGFPETGNLVLEDSVGDLVAIAYTGKSVNQFFNVSGVVRRIRKENEYSFG